MLESRSGRDKEIILTHVMYFIKEINKVKKYLHINISANNLLSSAVISQVSLPQNLLTAKHSKRKKKGMLGGWRGDLT